MNQEDYLAHHGVKGMRWGVRKERASNYTDSQYNRDKAIYGKRGANRINKSMLSGNSVGTARSIEKTKRDTVLGKNKYYRQAGKVAVGVGSAVASFVGVNALASAKGKAVLSKVLGTSAATTISSLASQPVVKAIVVAGAAKSASMLGGDLAVSAHTHAYGYNPNRKK